MTDCDMGVIIGATNQEIWLEELKKHPAGEAYLNHRRLQCKCQDPECPRTWFQFYCHEFIGQDKGKADRVLELFRHSDDFGLIIKQMKQIAYEGRIAADPLPTIRR